MEDKKIRIFTSFLWILQIEKAEFACPSWFPIRAKSFIYRILDPNPQTRIRIDDIRNEDCFKRGYDSVRLPEIEDVNLDDVNAVFDERKEKPRGLTFHLYLHEFFLGLVRCKCGSWKLYGSTMSRTSLCKI